MASNSARPHWHEWHSMQGHRCRQAHSRLAKNVGEGDGYHTSAVATGEGGAKCWGRLLCASGCACQALHRLTSCLAREFIFGPIAAKLQQLTDANPLQATRKSRGPASNLVVPGGGLEPPHLAAADFESAASTDSATSAEGPRSISDRPQSQPSWRTSRSNHSSPAGRNTAQLFIGPE